VDCGGGAGGGGLEVYKVELEVGEDSDIIFAMTRVHVLPAAVWYAL
jgi:hypothetical protein